MEEESPRPLTSSCMEYIFCSMELGKNKDASTLPLLENKCSPRLGAKVMGFGVKPVYLSEPAWGKGSIASTEKGSRPWLKCHRLSLFLLKFSRFS